MKILCIFFISVLLFPGALLSESYKGSVKSLFLNACQKLTQKESLYIDKICIQEVKVKYSLSTLMQEPIENYHVAWSINPTLYLRNKSVKIKTMPKKVQEAFSKLSPIDPTKFYISATTKAKSISKVYFIFDAGVMKKSNDGYSYNMAGSPSWDKFMIYDIPLFFENFNNKNSLKYLSKKDAIRAYKKLSYFDFGGVIKLTFAGISDLNWALGDVITYPLNVSVFDKDNNAHIDCSITLVNTKKRYRDYMQLKQGWYKLKIEAKGYKTLYKSIHFNKKHNKFTFTLTKEKKKHTLKKKNITTKDKNSTIKSRSKTKKIQKKKKKTIKKKTLKTVSINDSFNNIFEEKKITKVQKNTTTNKKQTAHSKTTDTEGSILMLIDVSGSMQGEKLRNAKNAAISSINSAVKNRTEVAVLSFSGSCSSPISKTINFTKDRTKLISFVKSLHAGGGTPLGSALRKANHFMQKYKNPSSRLQLILLLADGDGNCGNVNSVLNELKKQGIVFRHETIGLGIRSNSSAARDLKKIARRTGGGYHHTNNPKQLKRIFMKALDTVEILDMIGKFDSDTNINKKNDNNMQNILEMMN